MTNVERHYQAINAANSRDLNALLAVMDPEVEAHPRLASMEGSFHGHDGIRRWWTNLLDTFPDLAAEVVSMEDLGDLTLAAVHIRGHGVESDTPFDATFWQIARWRSGKCFWRATFNTRAEALASVGVSD
jgi:ketosteroid isomerase-like protein